MPESVCLSMILVNALGRSLSPSFNSSWCICFTDPCGSRRKPSADNGKRAGIGQFLRQCLQDSCRHADLSLPIRALSTPDLGAALRVGTRLLRTPATDERSEVA